ncbi:phosphate ABC transporter permease PstA [bacterium]|nr:phosphate ABC transporter permease PstA [bacterium]
MRRQDPLAQERRARLGLLLVTILVIVPVALIVGTVIVKGIGAVDWEFLSTAPRNGLREGGILPAIVGTLVLVAGAVLWSVPFGVATAIYLVEYAPRSQIARWVRLAILNLAGIPSVVYGLFGLGIFVIGLKLGVSILAGTLTLALMNLPVIVTSTAESLKAVPDRFRVASLALGASRWQTVRHIVLPNSLQGILTGIILETSRAAGETAPILFTVAAFYLPRLPRTIYDQVMALPMHLYAISTQVPNIGMDVRYGVALVLLGLVLGVNAIAIAVRSRMRRNRIW